ncbi:hypothetical protein BOX37_13070 [Nocardia mangyaensis]|uniref:HTH tetR-type domain-containing protein n=2 Tax=Nocardia mangyaensis TaxID=2213200 RepID=A0A1J0VRZ4_9NOCA|nr:hypothetical protein BOX37_13070 [Nocardia mangyaensis]
MAAGDATLSQYDWHTYPDVPLTPILTVALNSFQELGYHGTTVRAIAAGANLTMPTLYYHYGNKEGILFALLDIALDDFYTHIDLCLADADDNPLHRFENYITTVALHYTHRRDLAMLHDEYRFLGDTLREKYLTKRNLVQTKLEDLLQDGITAGIFDDKDPHFTARVLLGMLGGILDWYNTNGPLTPTEIADRYTHYAVRLVTKHTEA